MADTERQSYKIIMDRSEGFGERPLGCCSTGSRPYRHSCSHR